MGLFDAIAGKIGFARKETLPGAPVVTPEVLAKSLNTVLKRWLYDLEIEETTPKKPYQQHVWVYACLNAIATNIGQVPFKWYRDEKEVTGEWYCDLFRDVSPLMNQYDLFAATALLVRLYGDCLWLLEKKGSARIQEIFIVPGSQITEVLDESGIPVAWKVTAKRGIVSFDAEEVIHFKAYNPYNQVRGLSTLEAAQLAIDQDWYAAKWNKAILKNDATPGFVLTTDAEVPAAARERIRLAWREAHSGPDNKGNLAVLEAGLKPFPLSIPAKDLQWMEGRKLNRQEICAVFKVPPAELGIMEDGGVFGQESAKVQGRMFWQKNLIPQLRYFEAVLATEFLGRFKIAGIEGRFDLSAVPDLQEDFDAKVRTAQALVQMKVPLNAVIERMELGLKKVPWGDVAWVPFNEVPVSSGEDILPPEEALPEEAPPEEEQPPKSALKVLEQSIKEKRWNAFLAPLHAIESEFEKKLKKHFYQERAKVLKAVGQKAFRKESNEEILRRIKKILEEGKVLIADLSGGYFQEAVSAGGEALAGEIGGSFTVSAPNVREYIAEKLVKIVDVQDTNWLKLRDELQAGFSAGESIDQIADRIRAVYNYADARALTIARTEIVGSANAGRFFSALESGLEAWEWLTAPGAAHPRHEEYPELDGQKVNVGEMFNVGGARLQFPGDPGGPPEEIINCRCTTVPVIKE
jgi:HK97 family phage portal protein